MGGFSVGEIQLRANQGTLLEGIDLFETRFDQLTSGADQVEQVTLASAITGQAQRDLLFSQGHQAVLAALHGAVQTLVLREVIIPLLGVFAGDRFALGIQLGSGLPAPWP